MNARIFVIGALAATVATGAAGCKKNAEDHGGDTAVAEKESFGRLSVDELDAQMNDAKAGKLKLAVFDNNHKDRFDKGHIPGAKWVAFDKIQASDLPADKDTELVFYCANEH
jgi:Rhodanese-like domain